MSNIIPFRKRKNDELEFEWLESDEDDAGSDSAGSSGFSEPIMDMAIFGLVQAKIRQGERKFGAVPDPRDPYVAGDEPGERLQSHPLLSKAAEFNGIADALNNPNPRRNPDSQKNFQDMRQENVLRASLKMNKKLGMSHAPRPLPR
jgi:hypothetical protein